MSKFYYLKKVEDLLSIISNVEDYDEFIDVYAVDEVL